MHFDHFRLQRYILATCQYASGGLLDKVGKSPDLYHTCYVLSGLHLSRLCCDSKGCDASAEALLNVSSHKVSGIVDKSTSRFVQQYAVSMNLFKAGWLMQYIQVFQYWRIAVTFWGTANHRDHSNDAIPFLRFLRFLACVTQSKQQFRCQGLDSK